MGKPEGYPLPWCEALDIAYWQINMTLCLRFKRWSKWQAGKPMAEIIPVLDRLIEKKRERFAKLCGKDTPHD